MPPRFAKVPLAQVDNDRINALTADAQSLYFQVLRQPDLSRCGVLSYNARRIARQTKDHLPDRVDRALIELVAFGLVLHDAETDEVLVSTYFVDDGVLRHGWGLNAAVSAYHKVHSTSLRQAVVDRIPEKLRARFAATDDDVDDGALPFPQNEVDPQTDVPSTYPFSRHVKPVDVLTYPQPPVAERETKVLAAVVDRRIARMRETGTVIHSEAAYRAAVVDQVCGELQAVARRAIANNPHRSDRELAELLDPDRPQIIVASVRTHERPSRDPRTGEIWSER